MNIRVLSPEARAAVAEWLRERAAQQSPSAALDHEAACDLESRAEALKEAASELERLGPDALPHGIELRSSRLEALPQILRAAADALQAATSDPYRRGEATIALPTGVASSVTLSSPASLLRAEQPAGDVDGAPAERTPQRVDGTPITGPTEVLNDPPGHCYPAEAHRVEVVDGVERFRRNRIVDDLVEAASARRLGPDLNRIARDTALGRYTREERGELNRLIGYSLCGFADLYPPRRPP